MKYNIPLAKGNNDTINQLLERIRPESVILEFGCANGRMTKVLKEQLNCSVYIVEYDKNAIQDAEKYAVDSLCDDIMQMQWTKKFSGIGFDYIIFADVLEHLNDPGAVVQACLPLLKENGSMLVSVPNIAHNDVINSLWKDNFHYTQTGLLDNTHIHFWAYNELEPFFEKHGYSIIWEDAVICDTNMTELSAGVHDSMIDLEARPLGKVYEFVLQLMQASYVRTQGITKDSRIHKRAQTVTRRFFFESENGYDYDHPLVIYDDQTDNTLALRISVPEGTKSIRFDPIENLPLLLRDLSVTDDLGRCYTVCHSNGFDCHDAKVFATTDPQIYISLGDHCPSHLEIRSSEICYDITKIYSALKALEDSISNDTPSEKHSLLQQALQQPAFQANHLRDQLAYAEEKLSSALDTISQLRASEAKLRDTLISANQKKQDAEERLTQLQEEHHYYKEGFEAMCSSSSWRITKPLRFFVTMIKKLIVKILHCAPVKAMLKLFEKGFRKLFPKFYENKLLPLKYRIKRKKTNQELFGDSGDPTEVMNADLLWTGEKPIPFSSQPLVSVIVPNFNHAQFLRERLESVYNQTYTNFEVILLDDCSTDNSREILMEYAAKYPEKTICDFNEVNGGKVFKQWNKGIDHAKGQLIWIAESDDWCDLDFLEKMVPQFQYQSVMLAFARSIFMQDGHQIWTLEEYLSDIPQLDFSNPFILSAHTAVRTAFGIKNIVPNVSSAMFRNVGQIPAEITDIWKDIRLCGDWLFYLHMIRGGCISYTNETTNYYRVHKNSTSLLIQKSPAYYQEQELISKYIVSNYDVDLHIFERVQKNLEGHCMAINQTNDVSVVHENYNLDRIAAQAENRRPSILMCGFALQMGGGETYPIYLANEMKAQGATVAFLNFNLESYSESVRALLRPDVPLINLESPDHLGRILYKSGAQITHSHHASVDNMLAIWLDMLPGNCKQIVSLHGMYETIDRQHCELLFEQLRRTCAHFVYTADKNLMRIDELKLRDKLPLVKIGNGLPQYPIHPVDRASLGIAEDDFVLTLVSRALETKGWGEAVKAVLEANQTSSRKIHLLLIGDGPMRAKLQAVKDPCIHVLGEKSNIRDYFAMSDMGFLPSYFPGESFPLVVIDCLLSGKPVLASEIGEIPNQLQVEDGKYAGILFPLHDGAIDLDELTAKILQIANDPEYYDELTSYVPSAKEKFDISNVVRKYLDVYQKSL